MAAIPISRDDIDALAATVDTVTLPSTSKQLLSTIVSALRGVIGDQGGPIEVVVAAVPPAEAVTSIQEQFDAAFTPDEQPAENAAEAGATVAIIMKIGR